MSKFIVTVRQYVTELTYPDDRMTLPAGLGGFGSTREYYIDADNAEHALDRFHRRVPIGFLEEFEIEVFPGDSPCLIWVLEPRADLAIVGDPWQALRGCCRKQVIRAATEEAARELADRYAGSENAMRGTMTGLQPWLDPKYTTCRILPHYGTAGLIAAERDS